MKKNKLIICLSALLSVSLLATGCGKEIEVKNGSKVAVSTKGNKITATEYYEKIKEENITSLIDMIDENLLNKKYPKTDEETKSIEDQINQIKTYYGEDENTYKQVIKQYFGVESEKELENKLSLEYKRTEAVKDQVLNNIKDDEIKKYYEENIFGQIKAKHILIKVDVDSTATEEEKTKAEEKALEKAKKLIIKLNNGEDFSKLAKKNSDDEGTASNGGDLGYFDLNDMVSEFSEAVKKLKKNEYTKEPVKTEYGYHIILKTGEKKKPELKTVKEEVKEKIRDNKLAEDSSLFYKALKEFREDNKIKFNDDVLKKAYEDYMNELMNSSTN